MTISALTAAGSGSISNILPKTVLSAVTAAALLSLADQVNAYGHYHTVCQQFEVCEQVAVETCSTYWNLFGGLVQDCSVSYQPSCWLEEHCL
jgi:hypothetical protein